MTIRDEGKEGPMEAGQDCSEQHWVLLFSLCVFLCMHLCARQLLARRGRARGCYAGESEVVVVGKWVPGKDI